MKVKVRSFFVTSRLSFDVFFINFLVQPQCQWTPWEDNDDPWTDGSDVEGSPEKCQVEQFEVQYVDGGQIYNTLDDRGKRKRMYT